MLGRRSAWTSGGDVKQIYKQTISSLIRDRFGLPEHLSLERAVDAIWTLTAPEIADRLVRQCDWSLDDYETWLANALINGFRAPP